MRVNWQLNRFFNLLVNTSIRSIIQVNIVFFIYERLVGLINIIYISVYDGT